VKPRLLSLFLTLFLILVIVAGGCAGNTTVTMPPVTVTLPGAVTTSIVPGATVPGVTVTLPGSVTTMPPVTVTLPGSVTTIPGATVTVPPIIETIPPTTVDAARFLPSTPIAITTHKLIAGQLVGSCLLCHGPGEWYNMFPLPPTWDANDHGSSHHSGVFYVVPGSIQDHTGRDDDKCLTCHAISG
jgi:hypothetical protein